MCDGDQMEVDGFMLADSRDVNDVFEIRSIYRPEIVKINVELGTHNQFIIFLFRISAYMLKIKESNKAEHHECSFAGLRRRWVCFSVFLVFVFCFSVFLVFVF